MPPELTAYLPATAAFAALALAWWLVKRSPRPARAPQDGARGSMAGSVVRWLLAAVVLAVATGTGLYLLLGRPGLPDTAAFTTAELLDLLKIGLAVVGGLGAVVALAVAYRKQQVSEAAHVIATRQEDREGTKYLNERYGKAAEQLGHESFAVRLAGVYAMVGLADDWEAQRQTCVDVLCGYLRTPYPEDDRTEREVRQAIITKLLDHSARWRRVSVDFHGVEFEDLDLSDRVVSGDFSFDHAAFRGALTDFSGTRFIGSTTFRGAVFAAERTTFWGMTADKAVLDFSAASFTGEVVDFSATTLTDHTSIRLASAEADGCMFVLDDAKVHDPKAFERMLRNSKTPGAGAGSRRPPG
ncbi:pentapeptide repeat-containing protein [Actinosynnema sp. NPDC050801]|uniref:pentapeptide repeat-containing protein n=1 Tax=unclassified Actinosynnema TaxID=2637065 RepID=UPI0033D5CBED